MKILVELEYEPCEEDETLERSKEIIKGNIENCLGMDSVISIKQED